MFADNRCSYYIRNQQSGTISSPNSPNVYPNKKMCTWLMELELGYNVRLQVCYSCHVRFQGLFVNRPFLHNSRTVTTDSAKVCTSRPAIFPKIDRVRDLSQLKVTSITIIFIIIILLFIIIKWACMLLLQSLFCTTFNFKKQTNHLCNSDKTEHCTTKHGPNCWWRRCV